MNKVPKVKIIDSANKTANGVTIFVGVFSIRGNAFTAAFERHTPKKYQISELISLN